MICVESISESDVLQGEACHRGKKRMKPRTNNKKIEPQVAKLITIEENVRIGTQRTMYQRVRQQSQAIPPSEMVRVRYEIAADETHWLVDEVDEEASESDSDDEDAGQCTYCLCESEY